MKTSLSFGSALFVLFATFAPPLATAAPRDLPASSEINSFESENLLFGSSCQSIGEYTFAAMNGLAQVRKALKHSKTANESCGKQSEQILSLLDQLQLPSVANVPSENQRVTAHFTNPQALGAISSVVSEHSAIKDSALKMLAKTTLDTISQDLAQKTDLGFASALSGFYEFNSKVLSTWEGISGQLNQFAIECAASNRDQFIALFTGAVKISAAFSTAGIFSNEIANSINKLSEFLQVMNFSQSIAALNDVQFHISLACLMETQAQNYCSAVDTKAYNELFKTPSDRVITKLEEGQKNPYVNTPLEGYYLMHREMKKISQWIQIAMFGAEPRTVSQSSEKNTFLDTANEGLKDVNNLIGSFNQAHSLITQSLRGNESAQKQEITNLIQTLMYNMGGTRMGSSAKTEMNFYFSQVTELNMPFWLIGAPTPDVTLATKVGGANVVSWQDYMRTANNGGFCDELNNPIEVLEKMRERIFELKRGVEAQVQKYLVSRLVVDQISLGNAFGNDSQLSPVDAFHNILDYLNRFISDMEKLPENEVDPGFLGSAVDTQRRIIALLDYYQLAVDYGKKVSHEVGGRLKSVLDPQLSFDKNADKVRDFVGEERYRKLEFQFLQFIQAASDLFNIFKQRDTFLPVRLGEIIRYQVNLWIKRFGNLGEYERDLLLIAGESALSRMFEVNSLNPSKTALDLGSTLTVHGSALTALERSYAGVFHAMLRQIDLVAVNGSATAAQVNAGSVVERLNDRFKSRATFSWRSLLGLVPGFGPSLSEVATQGQLAFDNPGKYPIQLRTVYSLADEYDNFEQLRAKYCIQSLMFERRKEFHEICRSKIRVDKTPLPTLLKPKLGDIKTPFQIGNLVRTPKETLDYLSSDYDQLYAEIESKRSAYRTRSTKGICALRDHLRRNDVYHLIRLFEGSQNASSKTAKREPISIEEPPTTEAKKTSSDSPNNPPLVNPPKPPSQKAASLRAKLPTSDGL